MAELSSVMIDSVGGDPTARINQTRRSLTSFGVQLNVQADQTDAVNSALDSGEPLWFPRGDIYCGRRIVLPTKVNMQGAGADNSRFCALPGATEDMMGLKVGQIRYMTLRDFGFQGVVGNTQRGFIMVAAQSGANGGPWQSVVENLKMRGVSGVQLALLGLTTLGIAPCQWMTFKMWDGERPSTTSDLALYAHGQVEHVTFETCRFDGFGGGGVGYDNPNIYIGRSFAASDGLIGTYGTGTALSDIAPKVIEFINCTVQASSQAVRVDRAENVNFISPWFEDNKNTLAAQNSAFVNVYNPRCANAATQATNGRTFYATSSAQIVVRDAFPTGTNTIFADTDGSGSISLQGRLPPVALNNIIQSQTIGSTAVTQLDTGVAPGKMLTLNVAGVTINQINSSIGIGEVFTLKVASGSANGLTLANSGSGTLGFNLGNGVTSITVNPGDTVTLRKVQIVKGWDYVGKN